MKPCADCGNEVFKLNPTGLCVKCCDDSSYAICKIPGELCKACGEVMLGFGRRQFCSNTCAYEQFAKTIIGIDNAFSII